MSDGNIAVTYSLIYAFLKKQSQTKAADAVKKAARNVIILKDDLQLEGPHLDEIVKQWKESQAADSSSESDSSDDSSDDSSTSSSSDSSSSSSESTSGLDEADSSSSESESDNKKGIQACKKVPLSSGERETSATLSSDAKVSEDKSKVAKKKPSIEASSSSGSDSDSDNSTTELTSGKKLARKDAPKKNDDSSDSESSSSSPESSSSDSESTTSSSESESEAEIPISDKNPVKGKVASSKSRASTGVASTPKEEIQVMKKRKTSESGAAVVTAVVPVLHTDNVQISIRNKNDGHSKPPRNVNERFSRIKPQIVPAEQLLDNGYEAKGGITNDYGNRAHQDLIVTRGAGFRKEKNKKKRGSYRGGEITLQSHSIKFSD